MLFNCVTVPFWSPVFFESTVATYLLIPRSLHRSRFWDVTHPKNGCEGVTCSRKRVSRVHSNSRRLFPAFASLVFPQRAKQTGESVCSRRLAGATGTLTQRSVDICSEGGFSRLRNLGLVLKKSSLFFGKMSAETMEK